MKGRIAHFELGYIPESAQDLRAVAAFLITNHARTEVMNARGQAGSGSSSKS
ncbi:MAG: hypothetical protein R3F11_18810 [Verrucomicrobiales bacterium]